MQGTTPMGFVSSKEAGMGRLRKGCFLAAFLAAAIWIFAARQGWPQSTPAAPERGAAAAGASNSAPSSASASSANAASSWVGFGGGSSAAGGQWGGDRQSFEANSSAWTAGARSFAGAQPAGAGSSQIGSMTGTGSLAGVAGITPSNPLGGISPRVSGPSSSPGAAASWIAGARSFRSGAQPGGIWSSEGSSSTAIGSAAGAVGLTISNPLGSIGQPIFGLLPAAGASIPSFTAAGSEPAIGHAALGGFSSLHFGRQPHGVSPSGSFGGPVSRGLSSYPQFGSTLQGYRGFGSARSGRRAAFGFGAPSAGTRPRGLGSGLGGGLGSSPLGGGLGNSSPLGSFGTGSSNAGLGGSLNNKTGNGDSR